MNGTWQTNTFNSYYNATNLTANTTYEISTHTADTNGNVNTTWVNQTTKTLALNNPPYKPSNPSPSNGATNVSINADLSWTCGDPDAGDSVTYDVYFGTDSTPPLVAENQTGNTFDPATLNYSTKYYWWIVAKDTRGASNESEVWSFTTASAPVSGLVGLWHFDEGSGVIAVDSSEYGNDGTLVNGPAWVGGNVGTALSFDGIDDYVIIPDSPSLNPENEVTIIAWFKPGVIPQAGYRKIIAKPYTNYTSPWQQYALTLHDDQSVFELNTEGTKDEITGTETLESNTWYHVAGTYDGSEMRIYVNAVLNGTMAKSGTIAEYPTDVHIGAGIYSDAETEYINGTIDEVKIYNRALSVEEIKADYEAGSSNLPPTAIIDSIIPDPAEQGKDTVAFTGRGTDTDGSVIAYRWRSSIDGHLSTASSFSKPASELSVGTHTIYFKVQDDDGAWSTEVTEDLTINPEPGNNPPYKPNTPSPSDGAINISINTDLSWSGGDPDAGDTVTYNVYFGTDTSPPLVSENQNENTYDPGILNYSTRYYWRIAAKDVHNASNESEIWSFTTVSAPGLGLVGLWHFDEGYGGTAHDTSGNGNDGTINGASWVDGKFGKALQFDGSNDNVVVSDSSSISLADAFTLEAWVYPTNHGGSNKQYIIAKGDGNDPTEYVLCFDDFVTVVEFKANDLSSGYTQARYSYGPNVWSHVAITYNESMVKIYINGISEGWESSGGTIGDGAQSLEIGSAEGLDHFFGIIDEVGIYNLALSAEEIMAHYQEGLGDTTPPASISNLQNTTGTTWINWTWTNPTDNDFNHTMVYLNGAWQTNTSDAYYNATGLSSNTSYEIGTHTVDTYGNVNTTWVNQTTKTLALNNPPYKPGSPSPSDGATNVSINTDLSWSGGGEPDVGDTITYDVYFGTDSTPPLVAENQPETTYDPGTLNYSTKYYWRIVAKDTRGASNESEVWSFTTVSAPGSGLVGLWHFDEGTGVIAVDSSEYGNNGTLVNGPAWVGGNVGTALSFDGIDDYVIIPDSPSLNPADEITMIAWFKPDVISQSGYRKIIAKPYTNYTSPWQQYALTLHDEQFVFELNTEGTKEMLTGTETLDPNTGYHVVGTYDGSEMRIYVNAELNGTTPKSGAIAEYPTNVHIGAGIYSDAETEYINGTIDEVKIYNRALTVDEIQADYEAGSSNLLPIADPNGPYTGTEGVPITFDGSGSFDPDGNIISYAWDFGDGSTTTGVSPTHIYAQNGTYTVTLAVTDDGGATDTNTTTAIIADTDAIEPQVTNPSATPATILNDNDRPRVVDTNISQLNVTVTCDTEVDTVTINLSAIGGSAEAQMTRVPGTDIWTVTTNAKAGINITHNLLVNATDANGNSNTSKNIQLTVLRRGDVFRDNVVDMKDAVYIARYLAGLEPAVPNFVLVSDVVGESGNPTGDGAGNMKDGVYLARYLAGLEEEP